jgi:hypothetical protein
VVPPRFACVSQRRPHRQAGLASLCIGSSRRGLLALKGFSARISRAANTAGFGAGFSPFHPALWATWWCLFPVNDFVYTAIIAPAGVKNKLFGDCLEALLGLSSIFPHHSPLPKGDGARLLNPLPALRPPAWVSGEGRVRQGRRKTEVINLSPRNGSTSGDAPQIIQKNDGLARAILL